MARCSTVEIDGIGEVLFERSKRSKSLNIFVAPFKVVRVAIPYGISFEYAEEMVRSKKEWIQKNLIKMAKVEEDHSSEPDLLDELTFPGIKEIIISRVEALAEIYGFKYNKVTVRNQKTRWGSCSHKNNISLNVKLLKLPDELFDYVILHELMHTRVKNHKKIFWYELDRIVGDAKKLDSKLKNHYPELM